MTREQRTVPMIIGLGVLITGSLVIGVITPIWKEWQKARKEIQQSTSRMKDLEIAANNLPAIKKQYTNRQEAVRALKSQLPLDTDVAALVAELTALANQAQVKIENIYPETIPEDKTKKTVYQTVMIQIESLGGYHQLGNFLSLVEGINKPMQLSNLNIQVGIKNPKKHRIKLAFKVYVATADGATT